MYSKYNSKLVEWRKIYEAERDVKDSAKGIGYGMKSNLIEIREKRDELELFLKNNFENDYRELFLPGELVILKIKNHDPKFSSDFIPTIKID